MLEFIMNVWMVVLELAPWLLFGLFLAGVLHLYVPSSFVVQHLGKEAGFSSILKAVILGVPMPLCSCGVIPAALGIKKQGAGNGAATGFLISTPQTGIDSIMVSASMLGMPFALFKVVTAFFTGILGGVIVHYSDGESVVESSDKEVVSKSPERSFRELYSFAINDLLKMIWRWLIGGVLVSAAITTWLPHDLISNSPLANPFISMGLMLVISLPMYVCATASVPIAAALVQAGMPTGAALVFLMAGPASNITTIGAVYRSLGLKNLLIYLSTIIICSFAFGYIFDFVVPSSDLAIKIANQDHGGIIAVASGILLLAFILKFLIADLCSYISAVRIKKSNNTIAFDVTGMTCQGCANKINKLLLSIDGVDSVVADVKLGKVTVSGVGLDQDVIGKAIHSVGFEVGYSS